MDWMTIGSVVLIAGMMVFIFPRMRHAVKTAPKGNMDDWMGFIIPLAAIVGFIILLINMV
jgi:hypothetical protein